MQIPRSHPIKYPKLHYKQAWPSLGPRGDRQTEGDSGQTGPISQTGLLYSVQVLQFPEDYHLLVEHGDVPTPTLGASNRLEFATTTSLDSSY